MGIFTKKEKMNMETGKFEVRKKGLVDYIPKRDKELKKLIQEQKAKKQQEKYNKLLIKREAQLKKAKAKQKVVVIKSKTRLTKQQIRNMQLSPYIQAGRKVSSAVGKVEKWGKSFEKPKKKSKGSSKQPQVIIVQAGTGKASVPRNRKTKKRKSNSSSGMDINYFIGSSKPKKSKGNDYGGFF